MTGLHYAHNVLYSLFASKIRMGRTEVLFKQVQEPFI